MPLRPKNDALDLGQPIIEVAMLEDDISCRQTLAAAVEGSEDMHLAWQAATLDEARRLVAQPVDVLLVDLGLPDGSGLALIAQMRQVQPNCAVMVSTIFGDDDHLMGAVRAGALGYLLKDVSAKAIVEEIRSLHAGGSPINPMMARKLLRYQAGRAFASAPGEAIISAPPAAATGTQEFRLSPREAQVLQLVAKGYILDEVAAQMNITRHTARSFIRRIYQKLQVNNRVEAVRLAMDRGLLHAP
jgi:DNA-binding NarL/FixJ family response regulator